MTFTAGISGNANGRPKGTGYRQQIFNDLVMPHKEALIEKAIYMAMEGDPQMLKLLLERILPSKPISEPVQIELPRDIHKATSLIPMSIEFFQALERQEITPEQLKILVAALREHRENVIVIELSKRLHELEVREGIKSKKGEDLLVSLLSEDESGA